MENLNRFAGQSLFIVVLVVATHGMAATSFADEKVAKSEEAPTAEASTPVKPAATTEAQGPRTKEELRDAFHASMKRSAKRSKLKPHEFVPELTQLYSELDSTTKLSHHESSKMSGTLKTRLEETRDKLKRQTLKLRAEIKKTAYRESLRTTKSPELSGPAQELARANELIELIQTTIEPDHWDVNGGKGSMRYFPNLKVLVVRASGEVHQQLGAALP